jgi:hypothetical protein
VEAEPGTEPEAGGRGLATDRGRDDAAEPRVPDPQLARLTAERDALRASLTEAEQLLAQMPALRAAREELEALRGSRSWRATAPLRSLADTVNRELLPSARLTVKRALLRLAARVRGEPNA